MSDTNLIKRFIVDGVSYQYDYNALANLPIDGNLKVEFQVVTELPSPLSDENLNIIYLKKKNSMFATDKYEEFIVIKELTEDQRTEYVWENIGTASIDLSNYVSKTEYNILAAKVNALTPKKAYFTINPNDVSKIAKVYIHTNACPEHFDDEPVSAKVDTTKADEYKKYLNNDYSYDAAAYSDIGTGVKKAYASNNDSISALYVSEDFPDAAGNLGSAGNQDSAEATLNKDIAADSSYESSYDKMNNSIQNVKDSLGNSTIADTIFDNITSSFDSIHSTLSSGNSGTGELLKNITAKAGDFFSNVALTIGEGIANGYNDGITETLFGDREEASWRNFVKAAGNSTTNTNNFKNINSANDYRQALAKSSSHVVNYIENTPLSSENTLYGTMMLGVPPTFNSCADPKGRCMINSFVKDAKFLSLTPGLPKYNGSSYLNYTGQTASYAKQTESFDEAMRYLTKNGVDSANLDKDKRYYTFQTEYGKYYSYLETMLNTIWIKLGLAEENGAFNLFSFFSKAAHGNSDANVLSMYESALGFFVNPLGSISENITNERTSVGDSLASATDTASDTYQRLNYLTGMGSNIAGRVALTAGRTTQLASQMGNWVGNNLVSHTVRGIIGGQGIAGKIIGGVKGVIADINHYTSEVDFGAELQAFAATNGMRVVYPELWRNSSYSKSMNFDFNFVSPYGDPLAIFKYVYVPFCALLCFTLPRQADENGFVSNFFVRADMPGVLTCDLGMISNLSYTRGGAQGLFTKDGLPRAISGSFTVEDLYPYLAMTRRISFLSANPSYVSYLDSLIGLSPVNNNNEENTLNEYWKNMLNRVNGNANTKGLWNKFDSEGRAIHTAYMSYKSKQSFTTPAKSINWFRKV